MNFSTKYDLGQRVYVAHRTSTRSSKSCSGCNGEGRVKLNDGAVYICPRCSGSGIIESDFSYTWEPRNVTIGLVRPEVRSTPNGDCFYGGEFDQSNVESKIEYMVYETGVGSGRLYQEEELHETIVEAQLSANKLNNRRQGA